MERRVTWGKLVGRLNLIEQPGKQTIDLLFTDLAMPQLESKELSERLLKLHPQTKSLRTSSYTEQAASHQPAGSTGVAFLQKPFTPSSLARKIREVLGSEVMR